MMITLSCTRILHDNPWLFDGSPDDELGVSEMWISQRDEAFSAISDAIKGRNITSIVQAYGVGARIYADLGNDIEIAAEVSQFIKENGLAFIQATTLSQVIHAFNADYVACAPLLTKISGQTADFVYSLNFHGTGGLLNRDRLREWTEAFPNVRNVYMHGAQASILSSDDFWGEMRNLPQLQSIGLHASGHLLNANVQSTPVLPLLGSFTISHCGEVPPSFYPWVNALPSLTELRVSKTEFVISHPALTKADLSIDYTP